jgi:hypothetical protein
MQMKALSSCVLVSVTALALALVMMCPVEGTAAQAPESQAGSSSGAQGTSPKATESSSLALLHVYRQRRYVGGALAPSVYVDGTEVVRVGSGRRVPIKLPVGKHTFTSDDKSSRITIDAKPGADYYIRIDEVPGAWKGHGRLTLIEPEQGDPEYQLQKPIEPDRIIDKDMVQDESAAQTTESSAGHQ